MSLFFRLEHFRKMEPRTFQPFHPNLANQGLSLDKLLSLHLQACKYSSAGAFNW